MKPALSMVIFVFAACAEPVANLAQQPEDGAYSACEADEDCADGLRCARELDRGICTKDCPGGDRLEDLDPSNCPEAPPESLVDVGCVPVPGLVGNLAGFCALICDDGGACPHGMQCITEESVSLPSISTDYCG